MELSVINGVGMAFGFPLLRDPHVAFDGQQISGAVSVEECDLFSSVYDH